MAPNAFEGRQNLIHGLTQQNGQHPPREARIKRSIAFLTEAVKDFPELDPPRRSALKIMRLKAIFVSAVKNPRCPV
jgi:hypothetical protein